MVDIIPYTFLISFLSWRQSPEKPKSLRSHTTEFQERAAVASLVYDKGHCTSDRTKLGHTSQLVTLFGSFKQKFTTLPLHPQFNPNPWLDSWLTSPLHGQLAAVKLMEEDCGEVNRFLRTWAWKREHRSSKERFRRPYIHKMQVPGQMEHVVLRIEQADFKEEGFASTIWDSSIVMAKYFEKWPSCVAGKLCLDLSAGCGLVGISMAKLGGKVISTDLGPNLGLLMRNWRANFGHDCDVRAHEWGVNPAEIGGPFDVIVACDIMYIPDAVDAIVKTLKGASREGTTVYISHGRNRGAEELFLESCRESFHVEMVLDSELDEVYQSDDISVLRLKKKRTEN